MGRRGSVANLSAAAFVSLDAGGADAGDVTAADVDDDVASIDVVIGSSATSTNEATR